MIHRIHTIRDRGYGVEGKRVRRKEKEEEKDESKDEEDCRKTNLKIWD